MPELLRNIVGLSCIGGLSESKASTLKHTLIVCATGVMLGGFLQGCSAGKPSAGETGLANAAKDVTIPLEAGKMKNPLPETDEIVSQGQEVFLGECVQCHGAEARGDTTVGRNMTPPAMDLTSAHVQHWSDAELFWIIQNGVRLTGMPAWKSTISANDTWKLARYIHSLPKAGAATASMAGSTQMQAATSSQDKYTLKIPNGLAFSEFRGYEGWSVIAISHNGGALAAILGNPEMIDAFKAGIPGNGKAFPDGAKMAKVHWTAKVDSTEPGAPTVPGPQHDVDFMLKDSKRFADSGGWGYGAFEYDAASGTFRLANLGDKPPQGNDAKCGFACHTSVKNKDYVFTSYGHR
ncbi:cytochrome P460 family protein [Terriglobus sp. TAA 43]|uniref:cytochrome P460 family protein n=1 Tax=Terriglobus sp. TAA 43 TaxID=278961 RepID=UPI000AB00A8D|nr:cytochrome P460 family protein [Terriglobus sp. TAA 43]